MINLTLKYTFFRPLLSGMIFMFLVTILPGIIERLTIAGLNDPQDTSLDQAQLKTTEKVLKADIQRLNRKLAAKIPRSNYLVINTSANEFSLLRGIELIRKDKCSTGSYMLLKNGDQQEWMFKTPKGEFQILWKTTSPVWRKPDWAFVEAGLPVPPSNHHSRYEYGVLGDYALSLGDGYLIHGTLYQRLLGMPVTHGCVRLNDENLEIIYKSLQIGAKVYIY